MALYHYTDLNAVISILNEPQLRFTNLSYLNDSTELHDGLEYLKRELTKSTHDSFSADPHYLTALEELRLMFGSDDFSLADDETLFVASFSKSKDQLSQWRGYGSYCIEFDEVALQDYISLDDCIYSDADKTWQTETQIKSALQLITKEISLHADGWMQRPGVDCIQKLITLAAKYKHHAFFEENEVRSIYDDYELKTEYRVRGDILIPYKSIPISLDCIKGVTIGPMAHQVLAQKAFSHFVENHRELWIEKTQNEEFDFYVDVSQIPYRAP